MLEDMLLKWAVESKRRSRHSGAFRTPYVDHSSICTRSSPATPSDSVNPPRNSEEGQTPADSTRPKAMGMEQSKSNLQRLVSEEQAIILRDEKLLAASDPNPRKLSISLPPTPSSTRIELPTPALTVENMALLSRELEVNPFDLLTFDRTGNEDSDSGGSTNAGSTPAESSIPLNPRTKLARNLSSQVTVIHPGKRPPLGTLWRE